MKDNSVSAIAASAISDLISVLMGGIPLSTAQTTLQSAFEKYLDRRKKEAREILLEEIGDGLRLSSDVQSDRFFSLLFKYITAARQGAARLNLRLLAGLINGSNKATLEIRADDLSYYAELISQLGRDEVILIATLWKHHSATNQDSDEEQVREIRAFEKTQSELIPSYFQSKLHLMAVGQSAARTGLLVLSSVWGGTRIDLGPLVEKIVSLSSFEAALAKEPVI